MIQVCGICGCTDEDACIDEGGWPCWWVQPDLCSECAQKMALGQGAVLL